MTRDELIEHLDTVLSQTADGPPEGPHPRGTFVGIVNGPLSGLRLVAPDGTVFYLAVLEVSDLKSEE